MSWEKYVKRYCKYNEFIITINIESYKSVKIRSKLATWKSTNGKKIEYIWYGKYEIIDKNVKQHIGKDYNTRNIIVLSLKKLTFEIKNQNFQ